MSRTDDFYDVDGNLVRSEPIDDSIIQAMDNEANKAYLAQTDWYVTRKAETGKAIPEDVLTQREAARAAIIED